MLDDQRPEAEAVQANLYGIFAELEAEDGERKEKALAERRLAARRAIEQHFEKRELESHLKEYLFDG